jgi:hypothetical protein
MPLFVIKFITAISGTALILAAVPILHRDRARASASHRPPTWLVAWIGAMLMFVGYDLANVGLTKIIVFLDWGVVPSIELKHILMASTYVFFMTLAVAMVAVLFLRLLTAISGLWGRLGTAEGEKGDADPSSKTDGGAAALDS